MRAILSDSTIHVVRVKYGHPLGRGPEATAIGTLDTEAFNKSKAMELPRNIVIGHDALLAVGEVCQALKLGKKALIVADENTIKIAGKTVEKELTGRKLSHSEYLIPDADRGDHGHGRHRRVPVPAPRIRVRRHHLEPRGGEGLGPRAEPEE